MGLGPVTAAPTIMNMPAAEFVGDQDTVTYRARGELSTSPRAVTNSVFICPMNKKRLQSVQGDACQKKQRVSYRSLSPKVESNNEYT